MELKKTFLNILLSVCKTICFFVDRPAAQSNLHLCLTALVEKMSLYTIEQGPYHVL
jgi:hypothetical protein